MWREKEEHMNKTQLKLPCKVQLLYRESEKRVEYSDKEVVTAKML